MSIVKQLQKILGNNVPFLIPIMEPVSRRYIGWKYESMDAESIFTQIYRKNYWGGESRSGPGSDPDQTKKIITEIPKILRRIGAESILDIPCGDFSWQRHVDFGESDYIGADIVPDIIQENKELFSGPKRRFEKLDIRYDTLPECDVILCRDLFQHMSFGDICKSIHNIKSSSCRYLLASSQTGADRNADTPTGGWRKVNLLRPPFSFPEPEITLDEECPIRFHSDKSLLLWKIKDL